MKKLFLLLCLGSQLIAEVGHNCAVHNTEDTFYYHLHLQTYLTKDSEDIYSGSLHGHVDAGWNISDNLTLSARVKIEKPHHHHSEHEDHDDHGHDDDHDEHSVDDHSQWFEDHIGVLEELKLTWRATDDLEIYAGKFNPEVGFDYHINPGWYGYEALEHYAILEQIGLGMQYQLTDGDWGRHYINVSTFFQDTTFLSHSILADRKDYPNNEEDGGVGNTEALQSWAIQLAGDNIYFTQGDLFHEFAYAIGGAHRAANDFDDTVDENRVSLSLAYIAHFSEDINIRFINEICSIKDEHGESGVDAVHATLGAELNCYQWQIGGSFTDIDRDIEDNGHLAQFSLNYRLTESFTIGAGWLQEEEGDETIDTYGIHLTYSNW